MNFDSTQYEYIVNFRSLFVNEDRRNGGKKLSLSFTLAGRMMKGEAVFDHGVLPEQRRFKTDITLYHGQDVEKDHTAFIKKVNSFRQCLGLPVIKTDGVLRILDTTRIDFMELKQTKARLLALTAFKINPTISVETIRDQSHRFQWANSMFFKPEFNEIIKS